jgi:hypothetical protein
MAESLPEELQRAEKDGLTYTDLLLRLARAQWHHRQETALDGASARLRPSAAETFPSKPAGVKRQIRASAERTSPHLPTSCHRSDYVGKSGLAIGLLL